MRTKTLVGSAVLVLVEASPLMAQVKKIASDVACASCTIRIDSVTTLSDATLDGPSTLIQRDAAGTIYLASMSEAVVRAFGADGRLVRTLGRRGGGPGEFETIRNVLVRPDRSLLVLDGSLSRLTEFAPTGKLAGSTSVRVAGGMGLGAVVMPDGQIVVNMRSLAQAPGSPLRQSVLQRIDKSGALASLPEEGNADLRKRWLDERLLWVRRSGELLVAHPFTATIDVYSPALARLRTVARGAEWSSAGEPQVAPSDGTFDLPYTARLTAMWEDDRGRVWLVSTVPARDWKAGPALRESGQLSAQELTRLSERPRVETLIEVIDPTLTRVLARSRVTIRLGAAFGGGYFAMSQDDEAGEASVRVNRVQLKEQ